MHTSIICGRIGAAALISVALIGYSNAPSLKAAKVMILKPDVFLRFTCDQQEKVGVVKTIIDFLINKRFTVLDRAGIQREYGVQLLDVDIAALREHQQIVDVRMFPHSGESYSFTITTKPPTHRDHEFEESVIRLLSVDLGCDIYDRSENLNDSDSDTLALFEITVKNLRNEFEEAERLRGRGRI
jgi:hypothetical protein